MRKTIYVNSLAQFRDAGSNEDFTITRDVQEWPEAPRRARLISASLPYTWFNITSENNKFTATEGANTAALQIPAGNYTGTSLATALASALNGEASFLQNYAVSFNSQNLTYTLTTSPNPVQLEFNDAETIATVIGFAPGAAVSGTSITSGTAILLEDYEVWICTDAVRGSDNGVIPWNNTPTPDAGAQYQILARIPVTGSFGTIHHYTCPESLPFYSIAQSRFADMASIMRLFLRFPSGRSIDLNGYHWAAEIALEFD